MEILLVCKRRDIGPSFLDETISTDVALGRMNILKSQFPGDFTPPVNKKYASLLETKLRNYEATTKATIDALGIAVPIFIVFLKPRIPSN